MSQATFERFINIILKQHDALELLRILKQHDALELLRQTALNSPEHHTNLQSAVDKVLLENHIDTIYTLSTEYETEAKRLAILNKLNLIKKLLISKNVSEDSVYYITVLYCIENVNIGRSLSKELLIFLNKVYAAYDRNN